MKTFIIPLFTVSVLIAGCTEQEQAVPEHVQNLENVSYYSSEVEPEFTIRLEREMAFGDIDTDYFRGVVEFTITDDGKLIAVNWRQGVEDPAVYLFDSEGNWLQSIGGSGQGTSDYPEGASDYPRDLQVRDNNLYVFDLGFRNIDVFSLDDVEYLRTITPDRTLIQTANSSSTSSSRFVHVLSNGTILTEVADYSGIPNPDPGMHHNSAMLSYFIINEDGSPYSESGELLSNEIVTTIDRHFLSVGSGNANRAMGFDFNSGSLFDVGSNDLIYLAWSKDFLIKKYNSDGTYRSAIYYDFKQKPFDFESYAEARPRNASVQSLVGADVTLPETWPALNEMLVDDENRIWVSTIVENEQVYEWWILEDSGNLLGKLELPRSQPISEVKDGAVYIREADEEARVSKVVRYRLHLDEI